MENFDQPNDLGMAPAKDDGLQITPEVRLYWKETANWALFFAILLYILFGICIIIGLIFAFTGGIAGFITGLFVIAFYGAFLFFPGYYYSLFASKMKQALNTQNNALLDYAFVNLKRFYRYVGIMIIIAFGLGLLFFIVFASVILNAGSQF